jgi:acetolactate synthase-1/2/3 large subunit
MKVKTADFGQVTVTETTTVSGAEAIIKCLLEEGVDTIYGYPGGAIMPVYDELYKYQDKIHHILTRHEQGAAHAAQGYARVSGKVGVAVGTSGPGATNLITGIADAHLDSTPLVVITGQVGSHLLGSDAFQEIDIVGISTPVTKWNTQITKAEDIPEVFAKAFFIARSGRPGPVLIDITKDAQFASLDFSYKKCRAIRSYTPVPEVNLLQVERAAEAINNAKKPMIVFGQGVILGGAENLFREVVEKSGVPAAWTILGLSALPSDHPLNVGMVGMHGNYAPNILTNECDVLIAVGMRFDDRVTGNLSSYAKQAKIIHFEIDPAEINKNVQVDIPVLGDVKETLKLLLEFLKPNKHNSWHNRFKGLYETEYTSIIKGELTALSGEVKMAEVIDEINTCSGGDAIIVSDVGQHQMVTCRYSKFNSTRSSVTSGGVLGQWVLPFLRPLERRWEVRKGM